MRLLLFHDGKCLTKITENIEQEYILDVANSCADATYLVETNEYDAIVVDCSLVESSILDLCKELRVYDVSSPMILLLGKDNSSSRISYLEAGFNVCLYKPINFNELNAQLKSLIKSCRNNNEAKFKIGMVEVNTLKKFVKVGSEKILLRRKEYDLLEYLVINKGYIISKEELLEHVWDKGIDVFSNTVEVHIKNLRDKIERPYNFTLIKTIWNFGYLIEG